MLPLPLDMPQKPPKTLLMCKYILAKACVKIEGSQEINFCC